jgi:DNA-binding MarR family transcriptional regulator
MELVERTENPKDRRIKMVQLTQKGKHLRTEIMQELTEESQISVDNLLDKKEQTCFRQLIIRLLTENSDDINYSCPAAKK